MIRAARFWSMKSWSHSSRCRPAGVVHVSGSMCSRRKRPGFDLAVGGELVAHLEGQPGDSLHRPQRRLGQQRAGRFDRVVEHCGVQDAPRAACHSAAQSDQVAHRVEDSVRASTFAQPVAPLRQHRGMKRLAGRQLQARSPTRPALEHLQNHHRSDHLARRRRAAPPARNEIGEQLISKHTRTLLGQQRMHDPAGTKCPHTAAASNNTRPDSADTCIPRIVLRAHPPHTEIAPNRSAVS